MRFEPLTLDDVDDVARLEAAAYPASLHESREAFVQFITLFPDGAWGCWDDEGLCAFGIGVPLRAGATIALKDLLREIPADADTFYIHDVAALPRCRGRGVAHALVTRLLDVARQRGFTRCELVSVQGSGPFWQRFGFEPVHDLEYAPGARSIKMVKTMWSDTPRMPDMPRTFAVGHVAADPGSIASGALTVAPRDADSGTSIPITIVNGAHAGPVLALVAGIHGMEYVPIIGLQRLRDAIDPASLRGTVIMVHVANMPSFLGRTIYYSPVDGKNLNRVFPGRDDGSLSERIAYVLTKEVVERATHLVDLHGGDGNEWLRPYAYWITTGAPAVVEASRDLVLAFGLDHVIVDDERPADPAASLYLSNTAMTRGKPAITIETGCLARVEEPFVDRVTQGILGVMRHLGMRDDGPRPLSSAKWLARNAVLRASHTGMFYPAVACEDVVEAGALIGRVTDFHGAVLEEVRAPFAGEVLYIVATPPVSKGEPLGMIAAEENGTAPSS